MSDMTERFEDMSKRGRLTLFRQDDGDIVIAIEQDPDARRNYMPSVEFCTSCGGGGDSPNTHRALSDLFNAMQKDNEDKKQYRKDKIPEPPTNMDKAGNLIDKNIPPR